MKHHKAIFQILRERVEPKKRNRGHKVYFPRSVEPYILTEADGSPGSCGAFYGILHGCNKRLSPGTAVLDVGNDQDSDSYHGTCFECAVKHGLNNLDVEVFHNEDRERGPYGWMKRVCTKQLEAELTKPIKLLEHIKPSVIRTQKAAGIQALLRYVLTFPSQIVPPTLLLQDPSDLPFDHVFSLFNGIETKARPCPVTPRHGFVDSRVVKSIDEARTVWEQAREADPDAEMLFQPAIDAGMSAVLTPRSVSFGAGCDGATAGHNTQALRLGAGNFYYTVPRNAARIRDEDDPYFEVVYEKGDTTPIYVQLRGGPKIPGYSDYIPEKITVKYVHTITRDETECTPDDLLAWERLVPLLPEGAVVYHPGGFPTTHFGVHCVLHGVPYITSKQPHVGDTLLPQEYDQEKLNPDIVRSGMLHGMVPGQPGSDSTQEYMQSGGFRRETLSTIFALHNIAADRGEFASWYFGYSAARMFRLVAAACNGEARHFKRIHTTAYVPEENLSPQLIRFNEYKPVEDWMRWYLVSNFKDLSRSSLESRESRFVYGWDLAHRDLVTALTAATRSFLTHRWREGYGGLQWGRCGLTGLALYEAMIHHSRRPTPRTTAHLATCMNRTVNVVHNGGAVLTKFAEQDEINAAASLSRGVLLSKVLPVMWDAHNATKRDPAPALDERPRLWRQALPRPLIKYANNPNAIKRAIHWSGDPVIAKQEAEMKSATYALVNAHVQLWRSYVKQAKLAILHTFYKSWCDWPLEEAKQLEAEADELKATLTKLRAEIRKRKTRLGIDSKVSIAAHQLASTQNTKGGATPGDVKIVTSVSEGPNPCADVYVTMCQPPTTAKFYGKSILEDLIVASHTTKQIDDDIPF